MPKMKTHSGAKKRFNFSSNGVVKRKKAFTRHILTKKSSNRMRKLRKLGTLDGMDMKKVRKMLAYK